MAFSIVMGLSRAYLAAHWLSDATAGILLSMSCALVTALIVDQFQRRRNRLQRPAGTQFLPAFARPTRRGQPMTGRNPARTERGTDDLSM